LLVLSLGACSTFQPEKREASQQTTKPASNPSGKPGNRTPYTVFGKSYDILPESLGYLEIGIASWYGEKFHGRLTSNGEVYDMYQLSAAHKALPLPTVVRVTNLDNGKKTILRVNDRGPFHDDRLIDLSYKAALELGFADKGTAPVVVEAIDQENYPELHIVEPKGHSYYMQVGAFSRIEGAQHLMQQIQVLMVKNDEVASVRILQSELEASILHKVWIGPIGTDLENERISTLVINANLGSPIQVDVE
jgi:rare lipoprotein A